MEKKDIKYRKGFPTIRSMESLIKEFWGVTAYSPRIATDYARYNTAYLTWERTDSINNRLEDFILFLKDKGIGIESYRKSESPLTGNITLKSLTNDQ